MERYTKQMLRVLDRAKRLAKAKKHFYVGSEHLLLSLIKEEPSTAAAVLKADEITEENLLALIDRLIVPDKKAEGAKYDFTPKAKWILKKAEEEAEFYDKEEVGSEHLLLAILKEPDCLASRLLYTLQVSSSKLIADCLKAMGEEGSKLKENYSPLITENLEKYSRNLTQMAARGELDLVVGRESRLDRLMEVLSRKNKNNPCLIGEPGVGKTAIVEGLAQRIVQGTVPDNLKKKEILVLDLSGMVAGTKYRGEFEDRIKKILDEVRRHGEIILFIDEIHTIVGAGGAEGALDASNILKPSLSRGEIQVLGATTITEYRKYIEKDSALERRFQPIMVEEPGKEETLEILKGLRPSYEAHHKVKIEDEALQAAIDFTVRYVHDRFLPDKAIDAMDEAAAKLQITSDESAKNIAKLEEDKQSLDEELENILRESDFERAKEIRREQKEAEDKILSLKKRLEKRQENRQRQVKAAEIAKVISGWTGIPLEKLSQKESKRIANLEKILAQRVIGQREAIEAVSKAVKRGRVGLKDPNRPIGSFLFLGPTGVGKTELSKALAEAVFGEEAALIRVDMSEYMERHSVSQMIGSPPGYVGYDEGGQLSEKVRRNPYSVILFDEVEKAHPDVFNILLQVLDDGHITDAQGRRIDFKQTIIIMTSNAGAQVITEPKTLGFLSKEEQGKDYERMKGKVLGEIRQMFKPEFLNRIDEILVFHPLKEKEILQIVSLLLKNFQKRCMEQMQIEVKIQPSLVRLLSEEGFDSKYGARPLKRAIQSKIENAMAEEILSGNIKNHDRISIGVKNKKIKFTKEPLC